MCTCFSPVCAALYAGAPGGAWGGPRALWCRDSGNDGCSVLLWVSSGNPIAEKQWIYSCFSIPQKYIKTNKWITDCINTVINFVKLQVGKKMINMVITNSDSEAFLILRGNICHLQLQLNTKYPNEHIQLWNCSFLQLKKKKKRKKNLEAKAAHLCGRPPTLLYLPVARPVRSHSRLHRCSSNKLVSVRFSPVRFTNWWAYTTWPGEKNG